jgi:hypothetical protein
MRFTAGPPWFTGGFVVQDNFGKVSKNVHGARYDNPYEAPWVLNEYTQNAPAPAVTGGGNPYANPYQVVDEHFFDPITPNDPAFSDMEAPNEISTADPVGQIMSDFTQAQSKLKNNGGK